MHTRFSVQTSKVVPEDKEGFYYSLYTDLPNAGRLLGFAYSTLFNDYFRIDHDYFENIVAFHGTATILHATILFLPPFM